MCRSDGAYKALHHVLFANDVWPRWGFFYFPAASHARDSAENKIKTLPNN